MLGIARRGNRDCSQRAWRLSKIIPFNANLNAVYYKCSGEQKDKVAVLLNEQVIGLAVYIVFDMRIPPLKLKRENRGLLRRN